MAARTIPVVLLAWLCGCPRSAPEIGKTASEGSPTKAAAAEVKIEPSKRAPQPVDSAPTGRVLDGPLPIAGLLGKTPAEVEAQLAEPLGKGMSRPSCVRFVPERTWFSCQFALQRYGDKSGAYQAIGVEYEDGKSTAIAFEGLAKAQGEIDPRTALAYVGLELPGEPNVDAPEGDAKVWSWFNSAARLLIDGRQYRVVVSSVGGDWARTKVEIKLNDPLSDDERARVMTGRQPS